MARRRCQIAFVTLSILIFAFTIESLGVVIATALLIGVGALAGRNMRPLEVALTGVLLIVLTVATFVWGLGLIDRRWPVRALLRMAGSPGFATVNWGVIAVDQALHLSILAMLAVLLG